MVLDDAAFSIAWRRFAVQLLDHPVCGMIQRAQTAEQRQAISMVIELFERESPCFGAWERARAACRRACADTRGDITTGASTALQAWAKAGDIAVTVAALLAAAFSDQRHVAQAITLAGWTAQYAAYAELMAPHGDGPHDPSISTMSVKEAMCGHRVWMRRADEAMRTGYQRRMDLNVWYAEQRSLDALDSDSRL